MVIQGGAGSGKTSIALHRIAYLLYHDRKNLKSSSVLVLSPNGVFSDYISHIPAGAWRREYPGDEL